jgi:hypothetical protein
MLESLGAHNAYGLVHGVSAGQEPPTLRWIGRGGVAWYFHCDYVFVSSALRASVTGASIGSMEEWVESGLSHHCPVSVDLTML